VYFVYRKVVAPAERLPIALFASTGLPLIVVITTLGLADGYVTSQTAAALVTAGMLSVLFLPAVGLSLLRRGSEASSSKT
jgi:hypothetical protein